MKAKVTQSNMSSWSSRRAGYLRALKGVGYLRPTRRLALNRRRSWSNGSLAMEVTEVVKGGNRYSHCATGRNTSTWIRLTYARAVLTIVTRFALWQLIEIMHRCNASRWERSWFTQW